MGAWIEIFEDFVCYFKHEVAPHDGCVDWNNELYLNVKDSSMSHLVLRCVDWNQTEYMQASKKVN